MSRRDELSEFFRRWGWRSLLAGFIIAVLIQPFAVSFATKFFVLIDAPGYQEPRIESEIEGVDTIFEDNQSIDDFEGLRWKSDYRLLRFTAHNPTTRFLQNVEITLPLPSCSVHTNTEGPSIAGDFEITDPHTVRIQSRQNLLGNEYSCSKRIQIGTFEPGGRIAVEFVVREDYYNCDRLVGILPRDQYHIHYLWREHNEVFVVNREVEIQGFSPKDNFEKALAQEPNTIEGPHTGRSPDWDYYALLVGIDESDWDSGLEQCLDNEGL